MGYSAQSIGTWQDWTITWTGFSSNPSGVTSRYSLNGKICSIWIAVSSAGTSNTTAFTITLPVAASSSGVQQMLVRVADNGTFAVGRLSTRAGSNIADVYPSVSGTTWTASGSKIITCAGATYEAA